LPNQYSRKLRCPNAAKVGGRVEPVARAISSSTSSSPGLCWKMGTLPRPGRSEGLSPFTSILGTGGSVDVSPSAENGDATAPSPTSAPRGSVPFFGARPSWSALASGTSSSSCGLCSGKQVFYRRAPACKPQRHYSRTGIGTYHQDTKLGPYGDVLCMLGGLGVLGGSVPVFEPPPERRKRESRAVQYHDNVYDRAVYRYRAAVLSVR
jgi:hypothetical protein